MKFTRTVKTTTVSLAEINFKNGKPTTENEQTISIPGIMTEKELDKFVKKNYPANTVIVSSGTEIAKYEMSLEVFLEHATLIEDNDNEIEETEEQKTL